MKRRLVEFECDAATAAALADAIRGYAHAAYPPGGSECAQVARETLLDTATRCAAHGGGRLPLPKRQLPQLRSAVSWWLSDGAPPGQVLPNGLAQLLTER